MSKTYFYCDNEVGYQIAVSMAEGTCVQTSDYQQGNEFHRVWTMQVTFSIPNALPEDLRVWYVTVEEVVDDYGQFNIFTNTRYVDILEGQTLVTIPVDCKIETMSDLGSGGLEYYEMTLTSITLSDQIINPPCVISGCTLTITGSTVSSTSVRGADDGEITIAIAGQTGTTHTWRINGVTVFTGGTTQTFTDLAAGSYTIAIIEDLCVAQQTVVVEDGDFRTGTMSVNLPAALTASNNPIIFNASTYVNSNNPLQSISNFQITGTVLEDVIVKIELDFPIKYVANFYSKGFPYLGNYFLASSLKSPSGQVVGSNSAEEIATSLAEVMQNDLVIGRLYEIWADGTYINLRSYERNSRFDLLNKVTITGANISFTETQAGRAAFDGELVEDYSVYAELFINPIMQYGQTQNINRFQRVGEIELPFQISNQHKFDLSQTLRNFTSTPKLDFTFSGFTTYVDMMAGYYIKYGEKYPLIQNTATKKKRVKGTTDVRYVVNSALNYEDANDMTTFLGTQISGLNPEFDYTLSGYTFNVTDYLLSGYVVTDVNFRLRNETGTVVVDDWQTGTTFTIVDGVYLVDVSGTTSGYTTTVTRKFVFTTGSAGQYWDSTYPLTIMRMKDVKFLTNSPSIKQVHRNSTEYLGFILPSNYPIGVKCVGNLEFYNGTSQTDVDLFIISSGIVSMKNFGGVLILAVGYDKLGIADYENAGQTKIRKVEIWIENTDSGVPMSETKTYLYEIDEQPKRFGTAFLNKLGTYDIFDWQGEVVEQAEYGFQEYQQPRDIAIDGSSFKGFKHNTVYDTKYTKLITVNSGSINETTYDWLQEILQSNTIYNYTETNQPYLTVEGYTASKSTNENEYFMQVVFRATIHENNVKV